MHVLLGMLAIIAVTLVAPTDDVHPIEIKPQHESFAWSVELQDREATCHAKAWIGRIGEQPISTLFTVDLDETVALTVEGETPLYGLSPGTYDLHFEGDGCWWAYSLVVR